MADVARLVIEVDSDGVPKANARVMKLTAASGKAEKQTGSLTRAWKSFGTVLTTGAVVYGFKSIIDATAQAQESQAQLAAGLASTGGASRQTMESLTALADEMQRTTKFGDELVESVEAILLSFTNIAGDVFPRTVRAAADVATRMGQDLGSTMVQLAKALNDPVANLGALSRSGIQFAKDQKLLIKRLWETGQQAEAQRVILAELETQYGGSARAARETLGGSLQALSNSWGDLKESIGEGLAPALVTAFDALARFFAGIDGWVKDSTFAWLRGWTEIKFGTLETWAILKLAWGTLTTGLENTWITLLSAMQSALGVFIESVGSGIKAIEKAYAALGGELTLYGFRIEAIGQVEQEKSKMRLLRIEDEGAALSAFDAEMSSLEQRRLDNIDAITRAESKHFTEQATLQAASVAAARAAADAHDDAAQSIAESADDVVKKITPLRKKLNDVWISWSSTLIDSLLDAERRSKLTFESIATDFAKMVAKMLAQQAVLQLLGMQPATGAVAAVTAHGAAFSRGAQIAPFARGGVVDRPTLFPMQHGTGLMGEAGPEAVLPLTRTPGGDLGVKAEGAGAVVNVTVVNNTDAQVTQERRRTRRGEDIQIVVGQAVNRHIEDGGADVALQSSFGLQRRGRRR